MSLCKVGTALSADWVRPSRCLNYTRTEEDWFLIALHQVEKLQVERFRGNLGEEVVMKKDCDPISELERLDRFFDGEEEGEVPLAVLRAGGIDIPDDDALLDDGALHDKLWEIITAMPALGMVIEYTDHLTDRELYRYLVQDGLVEETILPGDAASTWHLSPAGSGSEEDTQIHLRFYFSDEEREEWHRQWGEPLPPKEAPRANRDHLLPTGELSRAERETGENVA